MGATCAIDRPASVAVFLTAARLIGGEARALGLRVPAFRSPPRRSGAVRTLRRTGDGGAVVAVALGGRPQEAVVADVVEGVILANALAGEAADRARRRLMAAVRRGLAGCEPAGRSTGGERPGQRRPGGAP